MRTRILPLLLLLGLALRLSLIFLQGTDALIDLFFFDDSFYLLNIARNIAAGNGITHDGLHMTNGFQPLYVLVLIPVYWVAQANRIFPVYFAAVLLSACSIVSAYLCFKIVDLLINVKAAYFSLLFTLFSPVALGYSLNGAETSLAVMFFLWAIYVYIRDLQFVRLSECPRGKLLVFGVLLGLAVLARIDMLILIFAIGVEIAWFHVRDRGVTGENLKRALVLGSVVGVIIAPWFIYNLTCFGGLIPMSGKAVRQIAVGGKNARSLHAARFSGVKPESEGTFSAFKRKLDSNREFLFYKKLTGESSRVLRGFFHFPDWMNFYWRHASPPLSRIPVLGPYLHFPTKLPALLLIPFLGPIFLLWNRREKAASETHHPAQNLKRSLFLILFSVTLILSYIIKVPGFWFFQRYFAPVYFVVVIFLSFFLFVVLDLLRSSGNALRYSIVTLLVLSLLAPWYFSSSANIRRWRQKDALFTYPGIIAYARNIFREEDMLGSSQSGYFSYFLDQKVHNLDGVVNAEALEAIERRQMDEYILTAKIDYLIDGNVQMTGLFKSYPGLKSKTTSIEIDGPSMFSIYKVDHSSR